MAGDGTRQPCRGRTGRSGGFGRTYAVADGSRNALWKKALRGEIRDHDDLSVQLANLADLVRTIDEHAFIPRAMDLAIALRHPIYDCIYLAIAEQNDDVLVTADARFLAAVRSTDHAGRVRPLVEPQS